MDVTELMTLKGAVRTAKNPDRHIRQRIADSAAELDRTGEAGLHCELLNEALLKLVTLLYRRGDDGVIANMDAATGRILVPAPWGDSGYKRWGLHSREAICLRHILMTRLRINHVQHLFDYSPESRTWFVNVVHYPDLDRAMGYLAKRPISVAEWRTAVSEYRDKRRKPTNG